MDTDVPYMPSTKNLTAILDKIQNAGVPEASGYDFGEPISGAPFILEQHVSIGLIPLLLALIAFVIHIAFAIAIFKDASARRASGRTVWFVHPIFWAGATFVGSVFVAAIYWVIHYSTLATPESHPPVETSEA